ncbi:uncharacterized protein EI97DRAFT_436150 [Westerdykella ornata]|uniref:Uncharacterized protein n=1 Tax=Westerdykella ornata TaxID=318751 RepID=A0A6A6JA51_WESOR|nr:uncharacterized protein EI97DRAFT_436150 [Westerdykella ornata]KAF2273272.1 hypothetical protein EI97DRAFT_436150 [Westerdykella ornata]
MCAAYSSVQAQFTRVSMRPHHSPAPCDLLHKCTKLNTNQLAFVYPSGIPIYIQCFLLCNPLARLMNHHHRTRPNNPPAIPKPLLAHSFVALPPLSRKAQINHCFCQNCNPS